MLKSRGRITLLNGKAKEKIYVDDVKLGESSLTRPAKRKQAIAWPKCIHTGKCGT